MPARSHSRLLVSGLALLLVTSTAKAEAPSGVEFFEKKIRPLLIKHCYECHSSDARALKGDLRLDHREGVLKGGVNGPALVPGDPGKSLLVKAVQQSDPKLKMPPKGKLSAEEIADLEAWIKMGAPDSRTGAVIAKPTQVFWSLQPVHDPSVPNLNHSGDTLTAIDRFIQQKLEAKGLKSATATDKRTLIRRATYDLIGLPPTPEEVEAFVADSSPNAFERVVDRLLASPAYGERWGRHWLDVIRYADTAGDNSDYPIPQMYRFRNWVIDAINRDMPYDEFVRQQIAGDLVAARGEADRHEKLIATGYLANTRRFGSYEEERYPWHLTIEDTIDNLGRTFLGLTINCCRCHDHKFDPLTQKDYYALYGFFSSTRYPRPGIELDKVQRDFIPLVSDDRVAAFQKERREKLADLEAKIKHREDEKKIAERALKDAEKIADEDERKERLAEASKKLKDVNDSLRAHRTRREDQEKLPVPYETAYAVAEGKTEGKRKVGNACVQLKGDPERLGPEVPRRFPAVLGGQSLANEFKGSGRLELANWIVEPRNPLTARVMVNRIWQYHFGRGLVPTPSDFGKQGQPPTHPELLDYLASRFIDSGWSLKAMHRMMMLSRTYQLSSADDPANAAIDVSNDYLWRFNRRRLDAESIRDTLLVVSGRLDRSPAGPHPFPKAETWNFTQHNPFKATYETNRRSVYLMTQRIQRHPFLALFDGPDTNASTATRTTSTTPLQSLFLMNDPFVHEQARGFSSRIVKSDNRNAERIDRAYRILFQRASTADEQTRAGNYIENVSLKLSYVESTEREVALKAWESLSRALFLSNEFVYVD